MVYSDTLEIRMMGGDGVGRHPLYQGQRVKQYFTTQEMALK